MAYVLAVVARVLTPMLELQAVSVRMHVQAHLSNPEGIGPAS